MMWVMTNLKTFIAAHSWRRWINPGAGWTGKNTHYLSGKKSRRWLPASTSSAQLSVSVQYRNCIHLYGRVLRAFRGKPAFSVRSPWQYYFFFFQYLSAFFPVFFLPFPSLLLFYSLCLEHLLSQHTSLGHQSSKYFFNFLVRSCLVIQYSLIFYFILCWPSWDE